MSVCHPFNGTVKDPTSSRTSASAASLNFLMSGVPSRVLREMIRFSYCHGRTVPYETFLFFGCLYFLSRGRRWDYLKSKRKGYFSCVIYSYCKRTIGIKYRQQIRFTIRMRTKYLVLARTQLSLYLKRGWNQVFS